MKIITERQPPAVVVLALCGTFDFAARADFRRAYEAWLDAPDVREIRVDLHGVRALDAAAPGMLLVLRERAREQGKRIVIANARDDVREALALTALVDAGA